MQPHATRLAVLNVLGGLAVLGSYAWGVALAPALRTGLWGGVPEELRGLYTVNMLLAAAGYFPFTWLLLFRMPPERLRSDAGVSPRAVFALYALVLIPSALWLPLTAQMIEAPSPALWIAIRAVLAAVGVGAAGLLLVLVRLARARGGALRWAAVAGALPFFTQTAILDAIVWPAYWRG
ncbi:MAG: hypothetical protein DCC71_23110 [Proteobacteria bacterium]|nr:MAG: hypothetical protein DCC71_23110 [Pseudomonadota bacterium]